MATLEQIGEALKRADAAGNVEDAKALAAAYRQMQAGQAATPLTGKVEPRGSGGVVSTNIEDRTPAPPEPSVLDKLMNATGATVNGITSTIPFLQNTTDAIGGTVAQLTGGNYNDYVNHQRDVRAGYAEAAPLARLAGEVGGYVGAGSLLGGTAAGAEALGLTGSTGKQIANSFLSSTGISTADALSRGKTGGDALAAGGIGGLTGILGWGAGKAVGKTGEAIANSVTNAKQAAVTKAAIAGAPTAAELRAQASSMFKAVDEAGVTVDTNKFSGFVSDLVTKAKKMRINPNLDAKATGAYEELIGALADVQRNGGALTISDLHTLRQIAQKASESTEGRDSMFAGMIVKGLDDFIGKSGNIVLPRNQIGEVAGGGNQLLDAISTWGRSRRAGLVETAIEKAKNTASGYENGLRIEFRKLLNNPETSRLWTPAERQAIEQIVRGTTGANLAKLVGKFGFGPGANGLGGFLGGTAGFALGGGPIGAAATAIGASGARKLSEKLTEKAANRAAQVVATPGIRNVPAMANPLLSAKVPIELLIRGGGLTTTN